MRTIESCNRAEETALRKLVNNGVSVSEIEKLLSLPYQEMTFALGTRRLLSAEEKLNQNRVCGDTFYDGITFNGDPCDQF